ncbi:hypothetical protein FACS1894107_06290 [Planctomycetales bacterium]|nr:hypothetical protein FACS1894107_06290 [Planctomycetales bacterium]
MAAVFLPSEIPLYGGLGRTIRWQAAALSPIDGVVAEIGTTRATAPAVRQTAPDCHPSVEGN